MPAAKAASRMRNRTGTAHGGSFDKESRPPGGEQGEGAPVAGVGFGGGHRGPPATLLELLAQDTSQELAGAGARRAGGPGHRLHELDLPRELVHGEPVSERVEGPPPP